MPEGEEFVAEDKDRPVLDEQALAKLLEAAYVLQEHNRELQAMDRRVEPHDLSVEKATHAPANQRPEASPPGATLPDDYTLTLAQIVETQHQIQLRHLELDNAMALVVERITQIANAGGAALGVLDGSKVRYKAAAGLMTLPPSAEVSAEKALCAACLQGGRVIRCEDVDHEFLVDTAECRRRGIQSMIAVPVYQVDGIAGGLELYYGSKRAFTEHDVHTCQLMAGLVTEALARSDETAWKKSLASEHSVMREALQKLKPKLAGLSGTPSPQDAAVKTAAPAAAAPILVCRQCGHELLGEEQFCGKCGSPRGASDEPRIIPGKATSLGGVQESNKNADQVPSNGTSVRQQSNTGFGNAEPERMQDDSIEDETPALLRELRIARATSSQESQSVAKAPSEHAATRALTVPLEASEAEEGSLPAVNAPAEQEQEDHWSSASSARAFLEQVAGRHPGAWSRFWHSRRGDFYLVIAVILVACVIRWGIWSGHSFRATANPAAAAAAHRKPAPDADLSLFDRMLVKLGLAEAPEPPEYKGNPETQVWVDLQTALYYCPGADLYGKTQKGKFTTQRDAQLDQFEPAYRKACN